jgi:hypothetical protein
MEGILELVGNPLVWKILITYWVFSAIVGAFPSPAEVKEVKPDIGPISLLAYKTVFSALHGLSGNLSRAAVAFKVPGAKDEQL